MFLYCSPWKVKRQIRALEGHLSAQLTLLKACRARAAAFPDATLSQAWIGHFIRLTNAMAAVGGGIANIRHAATSVPLLCLRLPALPRLPGEAGPFTFWKTTSGEFCKPISGLASSPAKRGRGTAEGGGGAWSRTARSAVEGISLIASRQGG